MKNLDLIKDLIISILIIVCIVLVISIIMYDKLSLSKVIPQSAEYALSDEMQEELKTESMTETTDIITTYYIDASDLKKYEKTKEYNKGKKDPFAEISIEANNNVVQENNENDNNSSSSTTKNENFYEDDGTK